MKTLFTFSLIASFAIANGQSAWKTYNHKNGFTIQLPGYFKLGLLVASGTLQWFDNTVDNEILVTVESFGLGTPKDLTATFSDVQKTFNKITYKVSKDNWFVISGLDDMGISYTKSIIRNGMQYHLRISYPERQKKLLDSIIPKVASSFK